MLATSDIVTHLPVLLRPDPSRTVLRPFVLEDPPPYAIPGHPRAERVARRILSFDADRLNIALQAAIEQLSQRHRDIETLLMRRFEEIRPLLGSEDVSRERALLIGAYFTAEFSFEAAALFNPSVTLHSDQTKLPPGAVRIAVSLRGIGEGHVSSVCFRTGIWTPGGDIVIDPPSPFAVPPVIEMPEGESPEALIRLHCGDSQEISETVIFPIAPSQRQGVEDLRLVRFEDDDGSIRYYGSYTAFSGFTTRQEMLRIRDFRTFEMRPVAGVLSEGKGMALFPRRINGRFWCLGRQDHENVWLMVSDDIYRWHEGIKLLTPQQPWECVQMGNCGSPIEIDEGWLVLTHGVGAARSYSIGACLLDKQTPWKVLGRMRKPLIQPRPEERAGYVPNVVYSCGALVKDRILLLPYGVADNYSVFATVPLDLLLAQMD